MLLVQNGAVAGRLTGGAPEPVAEAKEIFEQFRSIMEDEF